jgi:methyl-accepting chemotaxis protein
MSLFSPAIHFMERLSIPAKFAVVSTAFAVPLVLALTLLIIDIHETIGFAQKERLGLELELLSGKFLRHVQQHRGLVNGWLSGDKSLQAKLEAKQAEIAKDVMAMDAFDASHGESLGTSARWRTLSAQWQQLSTGLGSLSASQSFAEHTKLTTAILDSMNDIADQSNLTLDSELDSFYLMDTVVHRLAPQTEQMARAR